MSESAIQRIIHEILRAPAETLGDTLPAALEGVEKYGIRKLLDEQPDFLGRLLGRLKEAGAAEVFSKKPSLCDGFMDFLWEGVSVRAGKSNGMKAVLEKSDRDMHVNIEASDCPLKGHFIVEKKKISGRSGLLHFKDEDFRFMGPAQTLIELLTGDLVLGFSNMQLQTAGHSGWVGRVGPVVREVAKIIKGREADEEKIGSGI